MSQEELYALIHRSSLNPKMAESSSSYSPTSGHGYSHTCPLSTVGLSHFLRHRIMLLIFMRVITSWRRLGSLLLMSSHCVHQQAHSHPASGRVSWSQTFGIGYSVLYMTLSCALRLFCHPLLCIVKLQILSPIPAWTRTNKVCLLRWQQTVWEKQGGKVY